MARRLSLVINRGFFCTFLISLFFSSCTAQVVTADPQEEKNELPEIQKWFEDLCSPLLGGRYSGSSGIKASCDYLCKIINAGNDSLSIIPFTENDIFFQNIIFHIDGKTDSTLVFGAHYDAYGFRTQRVLPGADDNLSGVAVLLCLVNKLKAKGKVPKYCIDICFWDGEEIGRDGSRYYVNQQDAYKCERMFYINVDTVGSNKYYQVTLSYNPSMHLGENFNSFATELTMPVVEYNPYGFTTDCEPFLKKDIPFVNICCDKLPPYLHSASDLPSNVSYDQILKIANALFENIIEY